MALFGKKQESISKEPSEDRASGEGAFGAVERESKVGAVKESRIGSIEEKAVEAKQTEPVSEAEPYDIFGGKPYRSIDSLEYAAGKAPFKVPHTHELLQKKARKGIVEKYFAGQKYVDTEEFSRKINELEKKVPWIKSPNEQKQVRDELNFLKQLRPAA